MLIETKEVQLSKVCDCMVVIALGKVTDVKAEHCPKAEDLISVTELGIITDVKVEH